MIQGTLMVNRCKYCGFIGTNEEMTEHAGECSEMLRDYQPEDLSTFDILRSFCFSKYGFYTLLCILFWVLTFGVTGTLVLKILKK